MTLLWFTQSVQAEGLTAARLGVIYNLDVPASVEIAHVYAAKRGIPAENVLGIHLPNTDVVSPEVFAAARSRVLDRLPTAIQSLVLVWSRPYAAGCMSITTAFAAGYRAA